MPAHTKQRTVVGLFDDLTDAERAANELERNGIPRADINVIAGNESGRYDTYKGEHRGTSTAKGAGKGAGAGAAIGGGLGLIAGLTALAIPGFGPIIAAGPIAAALTGAGIGAAAGGLIGALTSAGVPKEHAEYYAEGVRRGGVLVTVKVDETLADRTADIMDRAGARDIDERSREWRASGWTGPTDARTDTPAEQNIPADRRQGTVRVFPDTHDERPDRRSAEHRAEVRGFEPFKEGTVEIVETDEVPVVSRTARVKEEVVVSKDVAHRTETVRDTVRSTHVEVHEQDFRGDFERRYAGRNYSYDRYRPAYETGYRYGSDERYRNEDWSTAEPHIRRDWELRGHGSWEEFKDSIRYGWDKVRGGRG